MTNLEKETKFETSRQDFKRLLSSFSVQSQRKLTNVYYDDAHHSLALADATFRIRLFDAPADCPVITLKIPTEYQNGVRVCVEAEIIAPRHYYDSCPSKIDLNQDMYCNMLKYLKPFNISILLRLGSMCTTRYKLMVDDEILVDLDHVDLPNGTSFYEIEFESQSISEHGFFARKVLPSLQCVKPSRISKYQRFIRVIKGLPVCVGTPE